MMKRIMVIGCPGSGKSTFSRALGEITRIQLYHLDMINWNSNRTTVDKEVFQKRLSDIIAKDEWIIDGNYGSTIELRLRVCDTVIFLDYPLEVCLAGIEARRGQERSDMPWIEPADEVDEEFIEFVKNYNNVNRPIIMKLLKKYSNKKIIIFQNRNEASDFLNEMKKEL